MKTNSLQEGRRPLALPTKDIAIRNEEKCSMVQNRKKVKNHPQQDFPQRLTLSGDLTSLQVSDPDSHCRPRTHAIRDSLNAFHLSALLV